MTDNDYYILVDGRRMEKVGNNRVRVSVCSADALTPVLLCARMFFEVSRSIVSPVILRSFSMSELSGEEGCARLSCSSAVFFVSRTIVLICERLVQYKNDNSQPGFSKVGRCFSCNNLFCNECLSYFCFGLLARLPRRLDSWMCQKVYMYEKVNKERKLWFMFQLLIRGGMPTPPAADTRRGWVPRHQDTGKTRSRA